MWIIRNVDSYSRWHARRMVINCYTGEPRLFASKHVATAYAALSLFGRFEIEEHK